MYDDAGSGVVGHVGESSESTATVRWELHARLCPVRQMHAAAATPLAYCSIRYYLECRKSWTHAMACTVLLDMLTPE
jgi:hypothetical protein